MTVTFLATSSTGLFVFLIVAIQKWIPGFL